MEQPNPVEAPSLQRVIAIWWPLAVSWILMSAEPPALAAVVARLADPNIHLAAYGSVTFPLIGIIQAPIITLLSLSTTMSKDWDSFQKGRKLMFFLGGGLTVLNLLITFTPLYYLIVEQWIGAPPEVVEPARLGMFIGLPWTFAVAYRRFHQGVLIRFEHTRVVTTGTFFRFFVDALVLIAGYSIGSIPGTVVATAMMVCGVITEAIYIGFRVRPVLTYQLKPAPPLAQKISLGEMIRFFIPLGLMPLLGQLIRPIGSAALSRLPDPLVTLAIWPVISSFSGLIFTPGAALNEVVITMLDRPRAKQSLRKFMFILMGAQFTVMLLLIATPLAFLWFSNVSGLSPELATLASSAIILLLPGSLISPLNSWFTGAILHSRRSRFVTEGMAIYLSLYVGGLWLGQWLSPGSGVYLAVGASMAASISQTLWLGIRSRDTLRCLD